MKIKSFIKNAFDFKSLNLREIILFSINLLFSIGLLIYQCCTNDGYKNWTIWVVFAGNAFNIISVIQATKKQISCFAWGILTVICFGFIAYDQQITGNMIMYWMFYIPAQIVAWVLWVRHSNDKVNVNVNNKKHWFHIIILLSAIGLIVLFSWIDTLDGFQNFWYTKPIKQPLIGYIFDSIVFIGSIAMTLYTWLRLKERWIVSIVVDLCQCGIWILKINDDVTNITSWIMLLSCLTMLMCAVYGLINWWKSR